MLNRVKEAFFKIVLLSPNGFAILMVSMIMEVVYRLLVKLSLAKTGIELLLISFGFLSYFLAIIFRVVSDKFKQR